MTLVMDTDLSRENEILKRELEETSNALAALQAEVSGGREEVVSYVVKVPAQRGWHRWKKNTYRTEEEAQEAAAAAAASHSKARVVERRSLIRERVVCTVPASGMEARQGGNEVPSRSDDSPAPQEDAR